MWNKMPTRCNRGFYCRSYCLLNMFRASPCPSSGAQEYYTVVAACGILCCGFSSSWSGVELRVMRPVCRMLVYFHILTTMHGQNNIKRGRDVWFLPPPVGPSQRPVPTQKANAGGETKHHSSLELKNTSIYVCVWIYPLGPRLSL